VAVVVLGLSAMSSVVSLITSLSFPLSVLAAAAGPLVLLLVTRPVTSPNASRFRFPAAGSILRSAVLALALEAAVAAVARVRPLATPEFVAVRTAAEARGFPRVAMREGRALAFSLSLAAVVRIARVVRLV
jgi:hypothetical protein